MGNYIFVSHADIDKKRIKPLIEALLTNSFELWIDRPEDIGLSENNPNLVRIRSGKDWHQEIVGGLEGCACVLFLLSKASNDHRRSNDLIREIEHGKQHQKLAIAKIDDISERELNPFFRILQCVDISE